jgi:acyl-CoA reductase-like NAD-dependent aldehyde dehydrogenase
LHRSDPEERKFTRTFSTDALLLIDGELVAAEGGRTFPSVNPATEEAIGVAADATVADTRRAIAAARRAFDETSWATEPKVRAGVPAAVGGGAA